MRAFTLTVVAVILTAATVATQTPFPAPSPSQQPLTVEQQAERERQLERLRAEATALQRQLLVRVAQQRTGASLDAESIHSDGTGEIQAKGNVTLTFSGGVLKASEVSIGRDGTIHITGDSQMIPAAR